MSIAGKPIAGCSPIAAAQCQRADVHYIAYWQNQSSFFGVSMAVPYTIPFFQVTPASVVYAPIIVGGIDKQYADCVRVPPHDNVAYAWPEYNRAIVAPLQRCPKEAA